VAVREDIRNIGIVAHLGTREQDPAPPRSMGPMAGADPACPLLPVIDARVGSTTMGRDTFAAWWSDCAL
jgi:hypothetical protein